MLSVWHRFCYTAIILFVALPSNGVEVLVLARERRTHNKRKRQRARGWEGRVNSEHIQILFAYLIRHTWQRHSANRIFVLLLSHTHSFTHSHTHADALLFAHTISAIIVQMNHKYSMVAFWLCYRQSRYSNESESAKHCSHVYLHYQTACVIPNDQSLRLMYERIMC